VVASEGHLRVRRHNFTLQQVLLDENQIGDAGAAALVEGLRCVNRALLWFLFFCRPPPENTCQRPRYLVIVCDDRLERGSPCMWFQCFEFLIARLIVFPMARTLSQAQFHT
jgi:hypothetical protein